MRNKLKRLLEQGHWSPEGLAERLGVPVKDVKPHLLDLLESGWAEKVGGLYSRERVAKSRLVFPATRKVKVGLVADTHLACREERLTELHDCYEVFRQEGITTVLHAGNPVDGYLPRINAESVKCITPHDQAAYFLEHYPQVSGIDTHFITGDDHEGWWTKTGWNWGFYCHNLARERGRKDLHYLGHVEADVNFGKTVVKVQHPGGGHPYARSYKAQKVVESLEGGEKPHVLVQGHYHFMNYCPVRNVHVVNLPGFQDQTIFGRKKNLAFEIGGAILEFSSLEKTGDIRWASVRFIPYFNRGYYKKYLAGDPAPTDL